MSADTQEKTIRGETISLPHDALDSIPSGVVKLNRRGDVVYANKAFCRMLGVESCRGLNVRDMFADDQNLAEVSKNLQERFTERVGNDYCVEVTRRSDGKRIPVNIIAVPETDESGEVVGSFGFVRDLTLETRMQQIHNHIETERDWRRMLEGVAREIGEIVAFDWLTVSIYSSDLRHTRLLFSYAKGDVPQFSVRWYEIPKVALPLVEGKRPIVIADFDAFFSGPEWEETRNDRDTQHFLQMGFRSCLSYPVVEGQSVAGIALYRKQVGAYRDDDVAILERLPVRRAVSMALHYLDRQDRDFRLELMRDIAGSNMDPSSAARLLVDRIASHYEWNNVSLFRVNEERKRFELMAQKADSGSFEISPDYVQELDTGVLGYVYQTKRFANSGDIHSDPVLQGYYRHGVYAKTESELAIPIVVDGQVCAILNSEDSRRNAYSDEERQALESVLREVAGLYKRLELQQLLRAIQQSTRDAIIRTDGDLVIRQVNKAATTLLGYDGGELIGTPLSRYFADPELAKYFAQAENPPGDLVELVRKNGKPIGVLLSGSLLPDHVGGRVYTASDLSWRQRVERLEFLREMYQEIGAQSQAPLSLCFGWLKRLHRTGDGSQKELVDKVIRQLKKVRLTFDRLSLFEREGTTMPFNPVLVGVPYIINGVAAELPAEDRAHLDLRYENDLPLVRGDIFQLLFCFGSALSHLLQFVPEDGKVRVNAHGDDESVQVEIKGKAPVVDEHQRGPYAEESGLAHALFELSVGGDTLHGFMEKHGGRFDGPKRSGDEEEFRFVIPTAH